MCVTVHKKTCASLLLAAIIMFCAGSVTIAQTSDWRVSKSTGEVWFTTEGAQPVALISNAALKPGDTVYTGQNGRVLLTNGAESILITANSAVSLPESKERGMTTVLQHAGTILLEVEKRNIQHFEVATPYLAAVVKGTEFEVTVTDTGSHVNVSNGQVQVTEFKSGKYALVNGGQAAHVASQGSGDLLLSGRGVLNPIQQGTPRTAPVYPIVIPHGGFSVPDLVTRQRTAAAEQIVLTQPSSVPAASGNDSSAKSSASRVDTSGNGGLAPSTRRNDENPGLMIALAAFVGLSVTAGAAIFRRKPKKKNR
jgi:hypothetical protein